VRQILNEVLTVAALAARNAKEAAVARVMGVAECAFGGSLKSGGRFVLVCLEGVCNQAVDFFCWCI
jgi:hypothetical protein